MDAMQEELMIMLMLYVANIDGKIKPDEVKVMLERFDAKKVAEIRQKFNKMNDVEVLQYIENHVGSVLNTDDKKAAMLDQLRKIIEADEKNLPIEEFVLREVETLLQ